MIKNTFILMSLCFFFIVTARVATEFEKAQEDINIRKTTMQQIWLRIKRLAPYVELNEQVDYEKKIAEADAKEIKLLLARVKDLWTERSNLSGKGYTNATPAIWALPDYFFKLYNNAEISADKLKASIEKDDIDGTSEAMCNLGNACGTCHANFRRLLTSQLANEVSGWSGQYIKDCN